MYLLHRSVGPSVQFLYSGCMIAAKFRIMTIEQRAVRGTAENFVICDTQKSYSENLFRRLSEKLSGYFQFHVFHDIENLKIAAKSMQVNILLIGEEYGKEDRDEIPARQKYLLIGEKIPNERSPTEIPFFRYQSVSSMLELLLQEKNQENSEVQTHQIQLVSDRSQTVKANVNGLIGIYSPVHRIGKTRFAMRMGRVLSESIPTLYLNLEGYSGLNYYLPEESGMNLGDLLYYMKQESINPVWKISTLISHMNGLDYIAPIRAEQDFREVTKEEWNQLLDLILEKSIYKVIILDLGDTVDGLYDLLGRCSKVYTPYIEEGAAKAKLNQYEVSSDRREDSERKKSHRDSILPVSKCQQYAGTFTSGKKSGKFRSTDASNPTCLRQIADSESKCKWSDRDLFTGSSNREDKICHAYGTSSFRIDSYVVSESGRIFRIKLLPAGRIRNESWRSAVLHEAGKYQSGMEDQYFDQPYEWVGLYRTDPGRTRFQRSDKRRMESTFGSDSGEEYLQSDHS